MLAVLLPALLTGMATTAGAIPFLFVRGVSRRFYDTLLGLGAGLMLAAATLGLLSTAIADLHEGGAVVPSRLALVLGGFVLGAALLRLMDGLIPHEHAGGHAQHVSASDRDERADESPGDPGQDGGNEQGGHTGHDHGGHTGHDHGAHAGHSHVKSELAHALDPHRAHRAHRAHGHPATDANRPEGAQAQVGAAEALSAADRTARAQGLLVVGVMFLHRIPEGLAIGAAWAGGGAALGLTLVAAIAVQNAVEGAVMAAPLRRGGLGGGALLGLVTATGLVVPAAALLGHYLSSRVQGALPPMLSLAAGALLYLTCNEVIPESHSHGNELRATYGLLAGFIIIMVLQVYFGHAV